jgi:glyoxylase-like metal-dependent hydrolase (beta-lactamase superfamily II)
VILTHHHMDHLGLVSIVARHSGAEVAALDATVPLVENYAEEAVLEDEFARGLMLRHGIPEEVVEALRAVSAAFRAWGARAEITRVLRDGDRVELRDRTFAVHHRPGHSVSDTVFHDARRRTLLAADHLLEHISSNALVTRPRDGGGERDQPLVTYIESLRATQAMDLDLVLPGHGDPVTDHRALIEKRFALHERRARKLRDLVAERPRTAYEIAQAQWGNIAVTQAYLTLSEVLGHMDLLLNEGSVREVEDDSVVRFHAA